MNMIMQRIPHIVWLICAVPLVGAVLRLPYGYYNSLRIVICGTSALIAVAGLLEETRSDMAWTAAFILIAVLFNPILPIWLHRSIWFYLDLMAAGVFAAHLVFCRTRRRNVQA
jgi:uncharacterized membrane protein YadS